MLSEVKRGRSRLQKSFFFQVAELFHDESIGNSLHVSLIRLVVLEGDEVNCASLESFVLAKNLWLLKYDFRSEG